MKLNTWRDLAAATLLFSANSAGAQGLLVDQASGTLDEPIVNASATPPNDLAQSFTPSFNSIGFVQLKSLATFGVGANGVVFTINLREGTVDGSVLSSTTPVVLPYSTPVGTFYFPDNVPIIPGQIYFIQPVVLSPGTVDVGFKDDSTYSGGRPWYNGNPSGPGDFWFREGIVVPEPSASSLAALGAAAVLLLRHNRPRKAR